MNYNNMIYKFYLRMTIEDYNDDDDDDVNDVIYLQDSVRGDHGDRSGDDDDDAAANISEGECC